MDKNDDELKSILALGKQLLGEFHKADLRGEVEWKHEVMPCGESVWRGTYRGDTALVTSKIGTLSSGSTIIRLPDTLAQAMFHTQETLRRLEGEKN